MVNNIVLLFLILLIILYTSTYKENFTEFSNDIELITYATHSAGNFNNLINNKFNIPIKVLGWNTKWNGFKDKTKGIYNYIKGKPDNHIIVYLDGFDTTIFKPINELKKTFLDLNCRVLFSEDYNIVPFIIRERVFGNCDKSIANCGLYMGYAKELKILLKRILEFECQDDQKIVNKICSNYNFIKVDKDNVIFTNGILKRDTYKNNTSFFYQTPGEISPKRIIRASKEYPQFLVREISIIYLVTLPLLIYKKKYSIVIFLLIFLFYMIAFADKSCIRT